MTLVLTTRITIPGGSVLVTPAVGVAYNDLFRAFQSLDKQIGYVLPKRLNRATFYRARYDDAIRL